MKKYVVMLALLTMQQLALAQTVNVHFKNGQVIEYPSTNIDFVDFSGKGAAPTITAGEAVDLGLPVLWASCDLGAKKPEETGARYAWGETKTKTDFNNENYAFYDAEKKQFIDIGDDISGTEYDAATVNLGDSWRMPTREEMQELVANCTWEWVKYNNIYGYKIVGKNGNSIFLPTRDTNNCIYRTSSYSPYSPVYTYGLWATSIKIKIDAAMIGRADGFPIRPVKSK